MLNDLLYMDQIRGTTTPCWNGDISADVGFVGEDGRHRCFVNDCQGNVRAVVRHNPGLKDRYHEFSNKGQIKTNPDVGWDNNIMGNSRSGKVEQRNINEFLLLINSYEKIQKNHLSVLFNNKSIHYSFPIV